MSAEEYFDFNNNLASMTLRKSGDIYKLIFDYANDQLFYVQRKLDRRIFPWFEMIFFLFISIDTQKGKKVKV